MPSEKRRQGSARERIETVMNSGHSHIGLISSEARRNIKAILNNPFYQRNDCLLADSTKLPPIKSLEMHLSKTPDRKGGKRYDVIKEEEEENKINLNKDSSEAEESITKKFLKTASHGERVSRNMRYEGEAGREKEGLYYEKKGMYGEESEVMVSQEEGGD